LPAGCGLKPKSITCSFLSSTPVTTSTGDNSQRQVRLRLSATGSSAVLTEGQLPCLFLFLEGLLVWLNFARSEPDRFFLYYPVVLVGLTFLILFFPARVIYHRSRAWWLYSNVGPPSHLPRRLLS
jgi:hypothetical protein